MDEGLSLMHFTREDTKLYTKFQFEGEGDGRKIGKLMASTQSLSERVN